MTKLTEQIHINAMVDLSLMGVHMYDLINSYLTRTQDHGKPKGLLITPKPKQESPSATIDRFVSFKNTRYSEPARIIHKSIIDDLVSYLNLPPIEALKRVEELIDFSFFSDIMSFIEIKEKDVLIELLKPYVLKIYIVIRSQFIPKINFSYSAREIGLDYVVIRITYVPFASRSKSV